MSRNAVDGLIQSAHKMVSQSRHKVKSGNQTVPTLTYRTLQVSKHFQGFPTRDPSEGGIYEWGSRQYMVNVRRRWLSCTHSWTYDVPPSPDAVINEIDRETGVASMTGTYERADRATMFYSGPLGFEGWYITYDHTDTYTVSTWSIEAWTYYHEGPSTFLEVLASENDIYLDFDQATTDVLTFSFGTENPTWGETWNRSYAEGIIGIGGGPDLSTFDMSSWTGALAGSWTGVGAALTVAGWVAPIVDVLSETGWTTIPKIYADRTQFKCASKAAYMILTGCYTPSWTIENVEFVSFGVAEADTAIEIPFPSTDPLPTPSNPATPYYIGRVTWVAFDFPGGVHLAGARIDTDATRIDV